MRGGFYNSFGLSSSNVLETIDVSDWDLDNTTSLFQLFYDLYSLTEIVGLDTWDTSNVTSMG
jgi:surface protein